MHLLKNAYEQTPLHRIGRPQCN